MSLHLENFVSIRHLYPRVTSGRTRLELSPPTSTADYDYRDLLSEANASYFRREYTIALQHYLELRRKIVEQSHPELPSVAGVGGTWNIDWAAIKLDRVIELSRRVAGVPKPDDRVGARLGDQSPIRAGEFDVDVQLKRWSLVGVDRAVFNTAERDRARTLITNGDVGRAAQIYRRAVDGALAAGNVEVAGDLANEAAVMIATYASGDRRPELLSTALESLTRAEEQYEQTDNAEALRAVRQNREAISADLQTPLVGVADVGRPRAGAITDRFVTNRLIVTRRVPLPLERTTRELLVRDAGGWQRPAEVIEQHTTTVVKAKQLGVFQPDGTMMLSLAPEDFASQLRAKVYEPRVGATTLEALRFFEETEVNFVAYYVHLYYFTLPIAVGDAYAAMGLYDQAVAEYRSVLAYPFLNLGIEATYLWLKVAEATVQRGNVLYRREQRAAAADAYALILAPDDTVPAGSALYQGKFAALATQATEAVKRMRGEAHAPFNPRVGAVIVQASSRQRYLAQGFNFFGIGADHAPVLRFKYLQSVATYLADNAIEAERAFISYRSTAENQAIDHMQLQSAVDVNRAAAAIEAKRLDDAELEVETARQTREYAELRRDNADAAVDEWDTEGRELTSMNAALSWAGAAANDQKIRYTGVRYDGGRHDYEGTVEEFFDTVGEKREWLDWELQRNRLERQATEVAAEVGLAEVREQQAQVRLEVQALNVAMQELRVEAAEEILEYSEQRMFDEDLWFQLAGQMRDLARDYLDAAIYSAVVMDRAYELEFDRRLNRIRLDYGLGGPAGLLGGDLLKRDIVSFTTDYLEHAQKKNPVRVALSLREEFPAAFATFEQTGILPFRTDLELFDRRYPGTYRRKLKRIEVFVEGLVPLEGASGSLTCHGVCSEWRTGDAGWAKHTRVMPVEQMVLSSYQFRRDLVVFQPSDELLGLFENNGPQADWTLTIPRSANNLDYSSIADITFVVYFDADVERLPGRPREGVLPDDRWALHRGVGPLPPPRRILRPRRRPTHPIRHRPVVVRLQPRQPRALGVRCAAPRSGRSRDRRRRPAHHPGIRRRDGRRHDRT